MGEFWWLNIVSDSLIAIAFFSIPFTLGYYTRKRAGSKLRGTVLMCATFMIACGATHLLLVWNMWHTSHRLESVVKAIAAAVTVAAAIGFAMINDISGSKRAADELKRVNEELRRSYAELEQFAHVASHDLQEPLRMITSYLQLIERRYDALLDDDGREFIHFAVDGAKRMKALIKDLLDFSRTGTDAANRQAVEARLLLENALTNLKTAIEESGAQITTDPLPTIVADPILFTQVFQNLIANAIKFQKGTAPSVHISVQRQAREWIFSVRDNGIGIEPHHRDRIFRIFERLHNSEQYSGSGIGLAITRKIVERHGGQIWVESQPGTGSTFHFSISAEVEIATAANNGSQ